MSVTLIASIIELCTLDHRDDPVAITAWTANKTEAGVTAMLQRPGNQLFVAERDGQIAAVGCVMGATEIGLNYVHPAHRFQGVSRALLAAMEAAIREAGAPTAHLSSTATAHAFYLANGWQDAGAIEHGRFVDSYPMTKAL